MKKSVGGVDRPYDYEVDDHPNRLSSTQKRTIGFGMALASIVGTGLAGDIAADAIHTSDYERLKSTEQLLGEVAREHSGDDSLVLFCADIIETPEQLEKGELVLGQYGTSTVTGLPTILIDTRLCTALYELDAPNKLIDLSVLTLSHEISHATGVISEGVANCEAVESFAPIYEDVTGNDLEQYADPLTLAQSVGSEEYHTHGC